MHPRYVRIIFFGSRVLHSHPLILYYMQKEEEEKEFDPGSYEPDAHSPLTVTARVSIISLFTTSLLSHPSMDFD